MGDKTKIAWADATWNPIQGTKGRWHCTKVSPGCQHCYAERMNIRFGGPPFKEGADTLRMETDDHALLWQPLRWKRPRRIFVESMGDLFHEDVPDEWIDRIVGVILRAPRHVFMMLTKRPERMRDYFSGPAHAAGLATAGASFPIRNLWLGVSVEDQQRADERLPFLKATPAVIRFVSCEPLLGPVTLWEDQEGILRGPGVFEMGGVTPSTPDSPPEGYDCSYPFLDWVIVGGESGYIARPMDIAWVRSLRDQCIQGKTSFFFKQWGRYQPIYVDPPDHPGIYEGRYLDGRMTASRVPKVHQLPALDGRVWNEWPETPFGPSSGPFPRKE